MLSVSQPVVVHTQRRLPARRSGHRVCPDFLLGFGFFSTPARDGSNPHSSSSESITEDPNDPLDCDASSVAARHPHSGNQRATLCVIRLGRAAFPAPLVPASFCIDKLARWLSLRQRTGPKKSILKRNTFS